MFGDAFFSGNFLTLSLIAFGDGVSDEVQSSPPGEPEWFFVWAVLHSRPEAGSGDAVREDQNRVYPNGYSSKVRLKRFVRLGFFDIFGSRSGFVLAFRKHGFSHVW